MRRSDVCLFRFLYNLELLTKPKKEKKTSGRNCFKQHTHWTCSNARNQFHFASRFFIKVNGTGHEVISRHHKNANMSSPWLWPNSLGMFCHLTNSVGYCFFSLFLFCSFRSFLFNSIFDINLWWKVVCRIHSAAFSASKLKMQKTNRAWNVKNKRL